MTAGLYTHIHMVQHGPICKHAYSCYQYLLLLYQATVLSTILTMLVPVLRSSALLGSFWEASFEHHCWLAAAASNVGLPACRLQLLLQLQMKADCRPTQAYQVKKESLKKESVKKETVKKESGYTWQDVDANWQGGPRYHVEQHKIPMVDRCMSADGLNMQQAAATSGSKLQGLHRHISHMQDSIAAGSEAILQAACHEHYTTLTEKQYMLADGSTCRSAVAAVARLEADCRYAQADQPTCSDIHKLSMFLQYKMNYCVFEYAELQLCTEASLQHCQRHRGRLSSTRQQWLGDTCLQTGQCAEVQLLLEADCRNIEAHPAYIQDYSYSWKQTWSVRQEQAVTTTVHNACLYPNMDGCSCCCGKNGDLKCA